MKRSAAIATNAAPLRRCAIYTRKSTVADVEQTFNSLQAQRESCESYIAAQRSSGWQLVDAHYDDNGFSGSNTDRPAFARLLCDIDAGKIDTVVVYKVDRLSRSLLDFATLMARFSKAGVEFVSTTQNFCTADAIGRLTLHMLMSFAEFEREMIGERTRDKCAAARRKGRWTGGPVPLGYRLADKKLIVEEREAVVVREIFRLYLEERSVLSVARLLNERRRPTKTHKAVSGRVREARQWDKADVLRVLRNAIYAGYMTCGAELHEGEHQGIVDRETFEAVREVLASVRTGSGIRRRNPDYVLGGILFCARCGSAFTAASTRKRGREWRYYRCVRRDKQGRAACESKQVRAHTIEDYVVGQIREATLEANLAEELVAAVKTRVAARRADLGVERSRLPRDIAKLAAEGKRLVDKIGTVKGGATKLLDRRLEEVGEQLARSERRLADVEHEITTLDAVQVEAGWVAECLRDFDAVWDVLTSENRGRLLRAVIERVDYDGRSGEVRVTLADLAAPATSEEAMSA